MEPVIFLSLFVFIYVLKQVQECCFGIFHNLATQKLFSLKAGEYIFKTSANNA